MAAFPKLNKFENLLTCVLIKTTKRLTFDIHYQNDKVTFQEEDEGDYYTFTASNGYQIISRSRMDIQTERLWLKGGANDDISLRSGTMVFSSNEKRDRVYDCFMTAIAEWAEHCNGGVIIERAR